jgi:predicted AAA+ superfamily ATPase
MLLHMFRLTQNDLKDWKNKKLLKPLLLTGARQVGKTWLMKNLGQNEFDNFVYLNFEKDQVTLTFYKNNEQIYSKEIGRDFNIHHALNLSKLDKGDYKAVLYAGGKQFKYPIEVQ